MLYVNLTARKTEFEYYKAGESCPYKGFDIKVCSYESYDEDGLKEKYGISRQMLNFDFEYCAKVVWLEVTLVDDKEAEACYSNCIGSLLMDRHCLVSTAYSNMPIYAVNESGSVDGQILYETFNAGETKKVGLVYTITTDDMSPYYKNHFDEYPMYLQFGDYERSQYIRRIRVN